MTRAQPRVIFKPPKGTLGQKKTNDKSQCSIYQAYEVLHGYIEIYVQLFRKALQSHIIHYNSC